MLFRSGFYIPGARTKRWGPQGLLPPDEADTIRGAAILGREFGRGFAAYVVPDIARWYAKYGPSRLSREVVARLLLHRISPPFITDAPANVAVTCRRRENRLIFHLLNVPSSHLLYAAGRAPAPVTLPEEFVPTGPIMIEIDGRWKHASSPLHPDRVRAEATDPGLRIAVDRLNHHEIIVLEA